MVPFLVLPVLAGLLGLAAGGAEDGAAYLPRLRFLLIGATLAGLASACWFAWSRGRGWRRWLAIVLALVSVRLCYPLILHLAVIVTGWLEWVAYKLGSGGIDRTLHYALGVFTAFMAAFCGLMGVALVAAFRRWFLLGVFLIGVGLITFADARDRRISPHPFASSARAPALYGPTYREVFDDRERPARARVLALGSSLLHWISPSESWGGAVRSELLRRFKGAPEAGLGERITALEAALVRARGLKTSPRTPPGS